MTAQSDKRREMIQQIRLMAENAIFSDQPWRAEYLNTGVRTAEQLLSKGNVGALGLLLTRLNDRIEKWGLKKQKQKIRALKNTSGTGISKLDGRIIEYVKRQRTMYSNAFKGNKAFGEICRKETQDADSDSNSREDPWDVYLRWSLLETEAWDRLCSDALVRIRISQSLNFSEDLSENWGPYNTKYNVLKALKLLEDFDRAWLESYLALYASIQQSGKISI